MRDIIKMSMYCLIYLSPNCTDQKRKESYLNRSSKINRKYCSLYQCIHFYEESIKHVVNPNSSLHGRPEKLNIYHYV